VSVDRRTVGRTAVVPSVSFLLFLLDLTALTLFVLEEVVGTTQTRATDRARNLGGLVKARITEVFATRLTETRHFARTNFFVESRATTARDFDHHLLGFLRLTTNNAYAVTFNEFDHLSFNVVPRIPNGESQFDQLVRLVVEDHVNVLVRSRNELERIRELLGEERRNRLEFLGKVLGLVRVGRRLKLSDRHC
jgi:hypothetical protein